MYFKNIKIQFANLWTHTWLTWKAGITFEFILDSDYFVITWNVLGISIFSILINICEFQIILFGLRIYVFNQKKKKESIQ